MSCAADDAEMFSDREILYLCRGKLLGGVRQEASYWEQLERYADTIDEEDARKSYPDAFHTGLT